MRAPSLLSKSSPLLSASNRPTGWCLEQGGMGSSVGYERRSSVGSATQGYLCTHASSRQVFSLSDVWLLSVVLEEGNCMLTEATLREIMRRHTGEVARHPLHRCRQTPFRLACDLVSVCGGPPHFGACLTHLRFSTLLSLPDVGGSWPWSGAVHKFVCLTTRVQ